MIRGGQQENTAGIAAAVGASGVGRHCCCCCCCSFLPGIFVCEGSLELMDCIRENEQDMSNENFGQKPTARSVVSQRSRQSMLNSKK